MAGVADPVAVLTGEPVVEAVGVDMLEVVTWDARLQDTRHHQ